MPSGLGNTVFETSFSWGVEHAITDAHASALAAADVRTNGLQFSKNNVNEILVYKRSKN